MMESGGEGHSGNGGRSGGGNGGLLCNSCELGVPHQWPSPFFPPHLHGRRGDSHHLNCLKLGKRQFFEEGRVSEPSDALGGMKRERLALAPRFSSSSPAAATALSPLSPATATVAPRCQVEGCHVALADAKDYHRRHKVCETHSKAPKVLLLGREQRFCQQCSRFHVISEFDDSKRSCRRRLAGHNERRRKSSAESVVRTPSPIDGPAVGSRVVPYLAPPSSSATSRALPLLSSKPSFSSPWTPPDLSSQSSAALRELIAENRAAVLAGQLLADRGGWPGAVFSIAPYPLLPPGPLAAPPQLGEEGWDHLRASGEHVTLDLMQTPSSSMEMLSARSRSRDDEEDCCEIWRSLEGTHVV